MTLHNCYVLIDNTANPYDLVLSAITHQKGTFSPSLTAGGSSPTTVAAGKSLQIAIAATVSFNGADATLVWLTGPPGDQATITMNFQNVIVPPNIATITVAGSEAAMMAYGVSYLYASAGDPTGAAPMSRDYAVGSGYPLRVNYSVVGNRLADTPMPFLPNIEKVVLLMLENRSLDHLLGQLYTESNPASTYYPSTDPVVPYAGLGDELNHCNSLSNGELDQRVFPLPVTDNPTTPDPDPAESFKYVNEQLWYSNAPGNSIAPMSGFLNDYHSSAGLLHTGVSVADSAQIMGFYTSEALPVISGLARRYAVSDAWFCSVPSQTYSNRAFSIAGTSSGTVDNDDLPNPPGYQMNTMFNLMLNVGDTDWTIFTQDSVWTDSCFVTFEFEAMVSPPEGSVKPISAFFDAASNGTLPAFSYIEPAWFANDDNLFINGNDYHPTANLLPGEAMLNQIYQALATSPDWNQTLLIVTFDEHGGTYDHVSPLPIAAPDSQTYASDGLSFDFTMTGVRVPTLLISPQIQSGMVFRSPTSTPFDHTSLLRTILGWKGIDVSGGVMGNRAAQAPDFSGVLTPPAPGGAVVNPGMISITPRTQTDTVARAHEDLPLNGLQRQFTSGLAHSLSGGNKGGEEHSRIRNELLAMPSVRALKAYVREAKEDRKTKGPCG
jgi:phospholipase C